MQYIKSDKETASPKLNSRLADCCFRKRVPDAGGRDAV